MDQRSCRYGKSQVKPVARKAIHLSRSLPLSAALAKDKVNANKQEEQRAKAEEELEKLHQLITQRGQWKANCEYNCSSVESIVGGEEEEGTEGTADKRWVHESVIKCTRAGTTTGSGDADDNVADTCC